MSREASVAAFLNGEISRRTFVRRLVAAGVGLTAAAAYADLLNPSWARAHELECTYSHYDQYGTHYDCHYEEPQQEPPPPGDTQQHGPQQPHQHQQQPQPQQHPQQQAPPRDTTPPKTKISGKVSLAALLLTGRFFVRFKSSEAGTVRVVATMASGSGKASAAKRVTIGRGKARFRKPGAKKVAIKVNRKGKKLLRKRKGGMILVTATATDMAGNKRRTRLRLKAS